MKTEQISFLKPRHIPKEQLNLRTITDVIVQPDNTVLVVFSDGSTETLASPAPIPARGIVSGEIVNGRLIIRFDNSTSIDVGVIDREIEYKSLPFTGEGLLVDPVQRILKPLVSGSPVLSLVESADAIDFTLDPEQLIQPKPFVDGEMDFNRCYHAVWENNTVTSSLYAIGGTRNTAWNYYDISDRKYGTLPLVANGDRSFSLPAGHYYIDHIGGCNAQGTVDIELYDATNAKVLIEGLVTEQIDNASTGLDYSLELTGEFYLAAQTTLQIRVRATTGFYFFGRTALTQPVSTSVHAVTTIWKLANTELAIARTATPEPLKAPWLDLTDAFTATGAPGTVTGTWTQTYPGSTTQAYSCAVKAKNGANYLAPASFKHFLYLSDDGQTKVEMPTPISLASTSSPAYGKQGCMGPDDNLYFPAYNAAQHVRIVPMPVGGWVRPEVRDGSNALVGYDYFPRKVALHDPHVTLTAPAAVSGHATILSVFQNNLLTGQGNEYYSVASATPELNVKMRQPVTMREFRISTGTYGAITAATLFGVVGGARTELGTFADVSGVMVATYSGVDTYDEYVVVITAAGGSEGAWQFGTNGIQMVVAEQIDTAKFEGVVEAIPNAENLTVTAKYNLCQSSPAGDEVMFIPNSNYATRGGFQFLDVVTGKWRKNTFNLTIDAATIFSTAICAPSTNMIYIFSQTLNADGYVYDPETKSIKAMPYMPRGIEACCVTKEGWIFGALLVGASYTGIIYDPVLDTMREIHLYGLSIGGSCLQAINTPDGQIVLHFTTGQFATINLDKLTCVLEAANLWHYLLLRKSNGDYHRFITRRLSGANVTISNWYTKTYSGAGTLDPKLVCGYYVN